MKYILIILLFSGCTSAQLRHERANTLHWQAQFDRSEKALTEAKEELQNEKDAAAHLLIHHDTWCPHKRKQDQDAKRD